YDFFVVAIFTRGSGRTVGPVTLTLREPVDTGTTISEPTTTPEPTTSSETTASSSPPMWSKEDLYPVNLRALPSGESEVRVSWLLGVDPRPAVLESYSVTYLENRPGEGYQQPRTEVVSSARYETVAGSAWEINLVGLNPGST
ncbi:hypothetical protein PoB_007441200, partial [Plakobranchus ocellatus]